MPPDVSRVEGLRLSLRLVDVGDAAYIAALRLDPRYNTHLSETSGGVTGQQDWIRRYKAREASGNEFYYIIERRADGRPCGVVRLYDIAGNRFTWGSWILDESKPPRAALESAILSFGTAFECLGLTVADIDVRRRNTHAIAFYRRFGMRETHEDELNLYFEYTAKRFAADKETHLDAIQHLEPKG